MKYWRALDLANELIASLRDGCDRVEAATRVATELRLSSGIYAIENMANGRLYIGSAAKLARRWIVHRSRLQRGKHDNRYLQKAWDLYGESAFRFVVIERVPPSELIHREQIYLDAAFRRALKPYNLSPTAGNSLGVKHTDQTRAKMSASGKGHSFSEETKRKIGEAKKGHPVSNETRRKLAEALTGRKRGVRSEETKRRLGASLRESERAKEQRRRLSNARRGQRGRPLSEEHKHKLLAANRGGPLSDEHRAKISEGLRAYWRRRRKIEGGQMEFPS